MGILEGVLIVDRRGDVRMCSEFLARRIGVRACELAGRPVWTLLPGWVPFGRAQAQSDLRLVAGNASIAVDLSWEVLHLPGETLYLVECLAGSRA